MRPAVLGRNLETIFCFFRVLFGFFYAFCRFPGGAHGAGLRWIVRRPFRLRASGETVDRIRRTAARRGGGDRVAAVRLSSRRAINDPASRFADELLQVPNEADAVRVRETAVQVRRVLPGVRVAVRLAVSRVRPARASTAGDGRVGAGVARRRGETRRQEGGGGGGGGGQRRPRRAVHGTTAADGGDQGGTGTGRRGRRQRRGGERENGTARRRGRRRGRGTDRRRRGELRPSRRGGRRKDGGVVSVAVAVVDVRAGSGRRKCALTHDDQKKTWNAFRVLRSRYFFFLS